MGVIALPSTHSNLAKVAKSKGFRFTMHLRCNSKGCGLPSRSLSLSLSLSEESPGSRWDSHLHLPSLTRQPALAGASTHVTQSILRRFHGTSVHLKLGALGEHGEKAGEGRSGAALLRWMESCRLFCEVPSSFPLPLKLHELVIA